MSFLVGIAGIVFSLHYVFTHHSTGFSGYLDKPSMVLIGLTPPCIMLLSHSLTDLFTGIRLLFTALLNTKKSKQSEIINILTNASAMVRTEGLGSIVRIKERVKYELLKDGLSLIVNNFTPEEIQHNLMARIDSKQTKMSLAANLFENMSKVCPGVGMIGTLMGLISMLANMKDPSALGSGMAMAMVTTLYGLMLGTILYAPWGEKIALEAEKSLELDLMVLEGILNIKSKKSSLHMSDIMKTYSGTKTRSASERSGSRS